MQLQCVSTDLQAKQKTNLGILSKTYKPNKRRIWGFYQKPIPQFEQCSLKETSMSV